MYASGRELLMLLNSEYDVLKAYSEGHVGWREASRRLDVEKFSEIEELLKKHGFPLWQPDTEESRRRMAALDKLLYAEDEL
jgi:hypothetical protein